MQAAVDSYERILHRLSSANTGKEALRSHRGREALASLVDEVAKLESEALGRLDKALAAAAA